MNHGEYLAADKKWRRDQRQLDHEREQEAKRREAFPIRAIVSGDIGTDYEDRDVRLTEAEARGVAKVISAVGQPSVTFWRDNEGRNGEYVSIDDLLGIT